MTSAALCSPLTRSLIHWMEFSRFRRGTETFPTQLSALMSPKFSRQPRQITCVLWNQRGAGSGAGGTVMKEAPKLQTHTHTFLVTSCGENEVLQAKTDRNSVIVLIFTRVKWNYVVLMKKLFFFYVNAIVKLFCFSVSVHVHSVYPGRRVPPLWLLLRWCDCDFGRYEYNWFDLLY